LSPGTASAQSQAVFLRTPGHFDSPASMRCSKNPHSRSSNHDGRFSTNLGDGSQMLPQNTLISIVVPGASPRAGGGLGGPETMEGTELTFSPHPLGGRQGVRWHDGKPFYRGRPSNCHDRPVGMHASEKLAQTRARPRTACRSGDDPVRLRWSLNHEASRSLRFWRMLPTRRGHRSIPCPMSSHHATCDPIQVVASGPSSVLVEFWP